MTKDKTKAAIKKSKKAAMEKKHGKNLSSIQPNREMRRKHNVKSSKEFEGVGGTKKNDISKASIAARNASARIPGW